jgi:hypothetical protein
MYLRKLNRTVVIFDTQSNRSVGYSVVYFLKSENEIEFSPTPLIFTSPFTPQRLTFLGREKIDIASIELSVDKNLKGYSVEYESVVDVRDMSKTIRISVKGNPSVPGMIRGQLIVHLKTGGLLRVPIVLKK